MAGREGREAHAESGLRQLAHALSRAEHQVTRELSRLLEAEGCSVEQWRALELLADDASHPMAELTRAALLPPATVTRLVDRMVADNLAYRTVDPRDRRRVLVRVTERGRGLHARLSERMHGEPAFSGVRDGELARLTALLGDLLARPER